MTVRETLAKDWHVLLILLLPFALLLLFWDQIPETVATHWNARGKADDWSEKGFGLFMLPLINLGSYLLLVFVPYIDPKKKTDNQQKALRAFRIIIPVLLTALFLFMLLQWLGYDFNISNAVYLGMSLLFLVMGNYIQAVKPNYFIGIRTPWTLENETIWRKTHRLGGKTWVVGALIMLVLWFFVPSSAYAIVFFVGVLILAFIPIGYSFYLYMKGSGVRGPGSGVESGE